MTPWTDRSKKQPTATQRQTAIDITAEDLLPRLSVQHVADLVLLSMVSCCLTATSLPLGIWFQGCITATTLLPRLTIKNVADLIHLCMMSCCLAATSLLDLSLYWPGLEFTFKDLLPTLSVQHGDCQHRVWQLVSCYITAPSLLDFLSLPARFEVNLWGFVAQTDSSKCGRPGSPSYGECCTTGTAASLLYLCLYWPGLKFTFWGFVANTVSSVLILLVQSVSDLVLLSMMTCCITVISLLGTSLLVFSDQV